MMRFPAVPLGTVIFLLHLCSPLALRAQQAAIEVWPPVLEIGAAEGDTITAVFMVSNTGEAGSVLQYTLRVDDPILPGRNISGSTLEADPGFYEPGTTRDFLLTVYNNSADFEWLTEIRLQLAQEVTLVASTDFVGGSGGDLVHDGATGPGALTFWTDENGGWGNVWGGESATAMVTLAFAPELVGDLLMPFLLTGDGYGQDPHELAGKLLLTGPPPALDLLSPNGGEIWAVGQQAQILWSADPGIPLVDIALSRDGGYLWESLAAAHPVDASFFWTATGPLSPHCRVRVSETDGGASDESLAEFYIHHPVDWCTLPVEAGECQAGEVDTLQVVVDTTGLVDLPFYTAWIEIRSNAPDSLIVLPLQLNLGTTAADEAPAALAGPRNWPNPFNPSTTIAFTLPAPGPARLELFDIRGRLVRTLLDGRLEAGRHTRVWDGRDGGGRELSGGVYLYRLTTAEGALSGKMTLLK